MTTVAATTSQKEALLADLARRGLDDGPAWLREVRQEGARRFAETELPHRRLDPWRQTNAGPILRTAFTSSVEPGDRHVKAAELSPYLFNEQGWVELVFVDGFLRRELCRIPEPDYGVIATSLRGRCEADDRRVKGQLDQHVYSFNNAFSELNSAFLLDGAYVYVAPALAVPVPIHLVFVATDRQTPAAAHPRNLIVLDRGTEATVVETYADLGTGALHLHNAVTEIETGQGSSLNYVKLVSEGAESHHLGVTNARLDRDARLHSFCAVTGSGHGIVRNELNVRLDGPGAECKADGLYLGEGKRLVDNAVFIDHARPHCSSRIEYAGVLDGKSHAVFSGKVNVRRDAQQTDSDQLNKNLLLSDHARVDTKPLLEIYADDVKCTHGSTVGRPSEELLFYFASRGIGREKARAMLTCGFADEAIGRVPLAQVRDRLRRHVFERYNPL